MPKRIRLQRTKGWRLPSGAVVVARPSRWGNPFPLNGDNRDEVLRAYREHVEEKLKGDPSWLEPLRGRDLACWCRLAEACHADVLIELANR
jgi:hypothetical protein